MKKTGYAVQLATSEHSMKSGVTGFENEEMIAAVNTIYAIA